MKKSGIPFVAALSILTLLAGAYVPAASRTYAASSRNFPETGKTVNDPFLSYWSGHGGLAQQGFPITDAYNEKNDADGKTYLTQYFERARFEYHPENSDPQFKVLLGLLGKEGLVAKYPDNAGSPPDSSPQTVPGGGSKTFSETGKTVTGLFLNYWNTHGGLEQQGFPITDAYSEVNDADGQSYITQYFERARFEYHPESSDPRFQVLLGLVGREVYGLKQASGGSGGSTAPPVPPTPAGGGSQPSPIASLTVPGWTHVAVATDNIALFYNAADGDAATARVNADGTLTQLADKTKLGTLSSGWTQIVPATQNRLFFYNSATGATSLSAVGDDGTITGVLVYRPYSPNWSVVAMDPASGIMMFYNYTDGTEGVARMLPDGQVAPLQSYPGHLAPGDTHWSNILPVGNGFWLRYSAGTGHMSTFKYADDGSGYGLVNFETSPTWSSIANNGDFMYFYDKTNAKAMTAVVTPETASSGKFVLLKTYDGLSREWTHIVAAPNDVFLIYSSTTGNIATDQIDSQGNAKALKRYSPAK